MITKRQLKALPKKKLESLQDKADRDLILALQHAARVNFSDPLCPLCLDATSENAIRAWNNERKKRLKREGKKQ